MKKKYILAALALGLSMSAKVMAQVPSYVPSNGLVGWWPFNGNANDESGNANNGTVNGAVLTTDRNNNSNEAYSFNGTSSFIQIANSNSLSSNLSTITISSWININAWYVISPLPGINNYSFPILCKGNSSSNFAQYSTACIPNQIAAHLNQMGGYSSSYNFTFQNWVHVVAVIDNSTTSIYINGNLLSSSQSSSQPGGIGAFNTTSPIFIGKDIPGQTEYSNGKLDDIGIWNRALTSQEIQNLFNQTNCVNDLSISPSVNILQIGDIANFTATTTDVNSTFYWQSDFGQGFQTLNDFGAYSGVSTSNLYIENVQLANHLQPIRVIAISGTCIDSSNVATINISDTCIVTINDTITTLISVTDTLIINSIVTSLTPPNNTNTIKVFPNPANDHITINYGNFASMNGYTIKIISQLGPIVFTSVINQQISYLDLSTWGGNGIYFVLIFDTQNNVIEYRKIVLQ